MSQSVRGIFAPSNEKCFSKHPVCSITNYQVVLFWFPGDSSLRVIYCFLSKPHLNKSLPLISKMLIPGPYKIASNIKHSNIASMLQQQLKVNFINEKS